MKSWKVVCVLGAIGVLSLFPLLYVADSELLGGVPLPEEECRSVAVYRTFCSSLSGRFGLDGQKIVHVNAYHWDIVVHRGDGKEQWRKKWAKARDVKGRAVVLRVHADRRIPKAMRTLCRFLKEGLDVLEGEFGVKKVVLLSIGKFGAGSIFHSGHFLRVGTKDECSSEDLRRTIDDDRVVGWFVTQHREGKVNPFKPPYTHPKLHLLPLGIRITDHHWLRPTLCSMLRTSMANGRNRWLYFNVGTSAGNTGPSRQQAVKAMERAIDGWDREEGIGTEAWDGSGEGRRMHNYYNDGLSLVEYHRHLGESRFVLSPSGTGTDCFRHWEALLHGAVPVMTPNLAQFDTDLVFSDPTLPALSLTNFSFLDPQLLIDHEDSCKFSNSSWARKLTAAYWNEKILNVATEAFP